jgi:hypothetical protein
MTLIIIGQIKKAVLRVCLAKYCAEQNSGELILKLVKSDICDIKKKKKLYRKMKKFCIVVNFLFKW